MNVKLRVLTAGAVFFIGAQSVVAQKAKKDTVKEIEEVVMMGYVKRKVSNTTGSSQQIKSEQVKNPSQTNAEFALQGQVSGVQVAASSGAPGARQDIRIRGLGTFTANSRPLYVIDGIPVIDDNFGPNSDRASLSPLASIPNEEIESLTVLKDASATAAYGARGSNGVIVVTTKRGRSGKARFTLSSTLGFQNNATRGRQMLSGQQRLTLLQEGLMNDLPNLAPNRDAALALITRNNLGNYNGWVADGMPNNNWEDAISNRNAMFQEHSFSVSGGTSAVKYYMSLNHNNTEPTVIGPGLQRTSANVKLDASLNPKTKVQTSVLLSKVDHNPLLENGAFFNNPFLTRYMMTPWYRPKNADGSANIANIGNYTSVYNTVYTMRNDIINNRMLRAFATNRVEYKLTNDLTLANNLAIDYVFTDYKNFENKNHGGGVAKKGTSYRSNAQNVNMVNQTSLNYVKRLGDKHRLDALALFEYQKQQIHNLSGFGADFPIEGLFNIASASTNFEASSSFYDAVNVSYLGMLNYSYADRLVLDATFRREGSSRFASGSRFGSFWSVGMAYNLHKDIFKDIFNELKIRSSYGVTGNAGIGLNEYMSILRFNTNYREGLGSYPYNYGNQELTWEKNRNFDAGLDFSFWNRRISGGVAYFNKKTIDLLQELELSRTTGFNLVRRNVGSMLNYGLEFNLSADVVRNDKFIWTLYGNLATLTNKITALAKGSDGRDLDLFAGSTTRGSEVGKSYGFWRMKTWAGVNPQTGAPEWYINGKDGDKTSVWADAAFADQGVAMPKYTGGFGTRINYQNFFVNALFSFAGGHHIYDNYSQFYMRTNNFTLTSYNGAEELINRWQNPGDITDVPKMNFNRNDNFHMASSRFLYDGTFVRLRNLQFGYNMSNQYLKSIGINGLTLQLTGVNLFTWVKDEKMKKSKLDPETGANGFIMMTTPPVKSISGGVTINF
ncbi:SusC/RagA family TonB-linked outer membrane protein [Riemerella anatipestifer]|uniref:SusC/RagA family TonB-linked outer membrane protein n=1 Tax=Riemerella anatipestifer TaxID=34085 RepID=UPI0030BC7609